MAVALPRGKVFDDGKAHGLRCAEAEGARIANVSEMIS